MLWEVAEERGSGGAEEEVVTTHREEVELLLQVLLLQVVEPEAALVMQVVSVQFSLSGNPKTTLHAPIL